MKEKIAYLALSSLNPYFFMKKALLFAAAALATGTSFAQSVNVIQGNPTGPSERHHRILIEDAGKTTKTGDTIKGRLKFPSSQLDSLATYRFDNVLPIDSGYAFGMNPFGRKAFAERYDISGKDSSVRVYGILAMFNGTVQANSNKTVTFNVWKEGSRTLFNASRPRLFYSGKPDAVLASQSVSIRNLGIGANAGADTFKLHTFTTPSGLIADSFFIGYTANYTWAQSNGDTIGLKSTRASYRYQPYTYVSGADTIINVINAIQASDNTWQDEEVQYTGLGLHFALFPYFVVGPLGISETGISNKGLTLFGNYPNPANGATNVKFSLQRSTKGSITLLDLAGRTLRTIELENLKAGENVVKISTSDLAVGNYIYLLRTSEGAGMAAQMTVAR